MSISDILLGDQDDKERLNKGGESGAKPWTIGIGFNRPRCEQSCGKLLQVVQGHQKENLCDKCPLFCYYLHFL